MRSRDFVALLLGLSATPGAKGADLIDIYNQALKQDPNVAAERKMVRKASFQRDRAMSGFFPTLKATAGTQWTKDERKRIGKTFTGEEYPEEDLNYQNYQYSLSVSQPLYQGGKNWVALDIAQQSRKQAESALAQAKQELAVRVGKAYFGLLDGRVQQDLARQELERLEQHLERAQARYEGGAGDILAVREAEARRDEAETSLIEARNQVDIARQRLRRLVGRPLPSLVTVETVQLQGPEPARMQKWIDQALESHPAIARSQAAWNEARNQVDKVKSRRWPQLEAQADYSRVEESQFYEFSYRRSIGLSLSWTFWEGGQITAQKRMGQMDAARAQAELDDKQREIRFQVVEKFKNYRTSADRVESLRAQVDSKQTKLEAMRKGFEAGKRHSVEVLDAEQEYFDARRQLAGARHAYLLGRIQLHKAAGVLKPKVLRQLNASLQRDK